MASELAYLVIREGTKWTDVFRLVPGQTVQIGRAPTNQIVLKDDRCSREHAELFVENERWMLRDLESRNGTAIGGKLIKQDRVLEPGDVIRIGGCQLVFVRNLSDAFTDPTALERPGHESLASEEDASALFHEGESYEPTTITHRKGHTRYLRASDADGGPPLERTGRQAAQLCRLAFELGKTASLQVMAEKALEGLFEVTKVDGGGILFLPRDPKGRFTEADLQLIASRSATDRPYHRVAGFLATTVMREGEAVLARNIMNDSSLGSRDSKGVIHATSVLCAPIRHANRVLGLIHLYSSDVERIPDPEDLEYALAVAETMAVAAMNLYQRDELAQNLTQVQDENLQLRQRLGVESEIVGASEATRKITEEIARAAASRATLLIRGESGVGKELVGRAVHYSSERRGGPLICLNCAALSEDLLASELFGHERGAFTGATDRKVGKFEAAHGGTLVLDEIGEMSLNIQAKFLRVLEGHPFERVGGNKPISVDVRVIAATNRDLEKEVAEKRFRHDLFFRLRVLEIVVPPLRHRPDDILALAQHFLNKFRQETGRKIDRFGAEATEQLLTYRWPGNIRELKNVVERAVVLCQGNEIQPDDLLMSNLATTGDTSLSAVSDRNHYEPMSLANLEAQHIRETLGHTQWNKSRAAQILGIERSTLDRKIKRYELDPER